MRREMLGFLQGLLAACCPVMAAVAPLPAAVPPIGLDAATATARVDCDHGQTIGQALQLSSAALVVEIKGTCHENINVPRDNVTLRGANPAAQVVGSITIDGHRGVTLQGFTVSKGAVWSVGVLGDGAAHITGMTVTDAGAVNILINGGAVFMEDTTSLRSGITGIFVRAGILNLAGAIVSNDNAFAGLGVGLEGGISAGFQALFPGEAAITTNNNVVGVLVEIGGTMEIADGNIMASLNKMDGLRLFHGTFIHGDVNFQLRSNGEYGINMYDSQFDAYGGDNSTMLVAGNAQGGINVLGNSVLFLEANTNIHNNQGPGLLVDQSTAEIQGTSVHDNTGADVLLSLGTKMQFDDANSIATPVACDNTVLTRGPESCGAPLPTSSQSLNRRGADARFGAMLRRLNSLR